MSRFLKLVGVIGIAIFLLSAVVFAQEEDLLSFCQKAKINWRAYEGTQLTIGLNKHPFTESLRPLIPVFEELTGIKVAYVILPEEEYFEKLLIDLSSGGGIFDVYMTSPMFEWRYQYAGWIEDLNKYWNDPNLTDQEWYDREDFYDKPLRANMWDGTIGGGLGQGRWNGIPVMVEFYCQAYRNDLREKWGLPVAQTYPELLDVLTKAAELGKKERPPVYGVANRGIKSWSTVHSGYFTAFLSYGQKDLTPDLYAAINTPEAIEITKIWIDILKKAGPPGWPNYTWYDAKQSFAAGRFYEITDCDFFAATYENPNQSVVAGKVGYALPPKGPDGTIKSNMWTWSLGMSSLSKHKEAAWLFLQWATAPMTMLDATLKYDNFNPTRKSVWEHPAVIEKTMKWGTKPGEYRELVDAMYAQYGDVAWTPNPDVTTVGDIWAEALHEAYEGKKTVEQALNDAAAKINEFMAKWREKKE
ncbi:extracellular solute-binding protein [Atrimonas thermophila]|uniref:extracellular solute-binding protein n=1 Tax=Atrimonas thermophila TaxID=3064161 RepID=UPI00399C8DB4